jgi:Flp pilus assembly pilin Flp
MWMSARKVLEDQSAATAIEYGMLIGLIAMALVFSMGTITNELGDLHFLIHNKISNAASKI